MKRRSTPSPPPHDEPRILEPAEPPVHLLPGLLIGGTWGFMVALAALEALLHKAGDLPAAWINIALLAMAAAVLTFALRRARRGLRTADAFLSLILLNPLLYTRHTAPLNPTLTGAALLSLITAVILITRRESLLRYLLVAALAMALAAVSDTFLMLLPAFVVWMLAAGYRTVRDPEPATRVRGWVIMAIGEALLLIFGLACILIEPTQSPESASLFSTITSFADFPLLVIAIILLSLGWHKGPHHSTPPYFAGMLALLVGLFTMLLNNFQSGTLPPPGTDQTVLVLCLVYTVSALHGPRRLQPFVPPVLLILAILYTFFR